MEINELINRLKKQAELYEQIDDGKRYGYDRDAKNIRETIKFIKQYEGTWSKLKTAISIRFQAAERADDQTEQEMLTELEAKILNDMDTYGKHIFGEKDGG